MSPHEHSIGYTPHILQIVLSLYVERTSDMLWNGIYPTGLPNFLLMSLAVFSVSPGTYGRITRCWSSKSILGSYTSAWIIVFVNQCFFHVLFHSEDVHCCKCWVLFGLEYLPLLFYVPLDARSPNPNTCLCEFSFDKFWIWLYNAKKTKRMGSNPQAKY